jgi:pyruvate/2-oxoglutarate dehydrogenase complex dihydrolipoamide acyltransferase (E2) component
MRKRVAKIALLSYLPVPVRKFFGECMAQEVRLPQLGKAMTQATIVRLLVGLNQSVGKGQVLCELETDKATLELESPVAGVVKHIFCILEQTLPIRTPLFIIAPADETVPADSLKKLQTEFDSLLASLKSNSPEKISSGGAIRPTVQWVEPARPSFHNGKKIPLTRRQRIIADKMLASKQHIPCFYLNIRVDVTDLTKLLGQLNSTAADQYAVSDFIFSALARGMKHYPIMTGRLGQDCIMLASTIDIGVVIAAASGTVAPVVRDVGSKTIEQISTCRRDLTQRAKKDTLTPDDLMDGCITVSDLGAIGVDSFIPIVIPGQCSILGVGRIFESPVPSGKGDISIRKMMNLNLSIDHRIANGADAAQFLDFVKKQLEHPAELLK